MPIVHDDSDISVEALLLDMHRALSQDQVDLEPKLKAAILAKLPNLYY
jgi:hypothetical protein